MAAAQRLPQPRRGAAQRNRQNCGSDRLSQEGPDMAYGFLDIAATASVKEAQRENGSADYWACFHGDRTLDPFTENQAEFIAARDSFYMATVSESGWPYVQHRGGPPGFIRMLDDKTLAVADYRRNRQYIPGGPAPAAGR